MGKYILHLFLWSFLFLYIIIDFYVYILIKSEKEKRGSTRGGRKGWEGREKWRAPGRLKEEEKEEKELEVFKYQALSQVRKLNSLTLRRTPLRGGEIQK